MKLGCCRYALQEGLVLESAMARHKARDNRGGLGWLNAPDLQQFLLVISQGAFLCRLRLSFDTPLISLVNWADVAVKIG